ncbi:MAG: hypothetical protein K2X93_16900, partial [Candidatus Obscuribacterales bacterium]|nr:hypothetical protein [Candidatus Obscuribacterales bacterium]
MNQSIREDAAKTALADIRWLLKSSHHDTTEDPSGSGESYLDGPQIAELLERNFQRLDPDNNGLTRDELTSAMTHPASFSKDEYEMLRLVTKYFDTIINMSDDEDGEELKISRMDMVVLNQFLIHGTMTLKELSRWCNSVEQEVGLPPSSE